MGATYTRQSSSNIVDGNVIEASDLNNEFNQVLAAFVASSGHTHDGTAAEGGAVTKLLGNTLTFGAATAGTDITITFDGETADGVMKWMEDEDYFEFSDDILVASTEKLQFRDTAIYINSSADGQLDLVADTEIQIAATTIDINGNVDVSGTLAVTGDLTVSGDDLTMGTNTDTAIMVADGTNFNPVVPSGDVGLTNAGVFSIASNVIVNADINSSAAIADSKLATISTADKVSGAAIQIDGATDGTSITVADADKILIDDAGTTKYITASQLNTYTSSSVAADDIGTGDAAVTLATSSGNITIDATANNSDIIFKGTDATADITMLTLDGSEAGAATFNNKVVATELDISGDTDIDGTTNLDNTDIDGTLAVDGTTISLDATTSLNIDNSNTTNGITLGTATSGVPISIGHTTSETTINDNATVTGNLSVGGTFDVTGTIDFSDSAITNAGDIQLDSITGDGDTNTSITFSGSDVITIATGGAGRLTIGDGALSPVTNNQIDLGTSSLEFKDAFFDGTVTADAFAGPLTGNVTGNASGTAATVTTAAQSNITSLGTLTALTVDDVAIDGKVVTMTGSASDTAVFTAGTNGTLSIITTDAAAAAANIQITADGTIDIDSAGVLTLDSGAAINIEPAVGSAILLDGTISIDAGVVTGATSITSTAFVGDITGDVTGNTSGTAATVTTAAQSNITSLGTLTTLTVDNVIINGSTIGHTSDTDLITVASGIATVAGEVSMTTLDIGGTNVTSTAAELNIMDGNTSATSTTLADADRLVTNDNGTMVQVALSDVKTYLTSAGFSSEDPTALAIALG